MKMMAGPFLIILTSVLLAAELSADASGLSVDPVVIQYGGTVVTRAEVDRRFQVAVRILANRQGILLADQDPAAIARLREQYLDKYARELAFLRAAERRKLVVSEAEVDQALAKLLEGDSELIDDAMLRSIVRDEQTIELLTETMLQEIRIPPGDVITMHHDVKDSLATHEEFCVRHVQLDSAVMASDVRIKLEEGASFDEVAALLSTDVETAQNGGDLGCFERVVSAPRSEFERAVFGAVEGELVGPVESEVGYHVILVYEHIMPRAPTLDEAYTEIERELALEQLPARLQELVAASDIDVYADAFRVSSD